MIPFPHRPAKTLAGLAISPPTFYGEVEETLFLYKLIRANMFGLLVPPQTLPAEDGRVLLPQTS